MLKRDKSPLAVEIPERTGFAPTLYVYLSDSESNMSWHSSILRSVSLSELLPASIVAMRLIASMSRKE